MAPEQTKLWIQVREDINILTRMRQECEKGTAEWMRLTLLINSKKAYIKRLTSGKSEQCSAADQGD